MIEADVVDLLFGMAKRHMLHIDDGVSPLLAKLLDLVSGIHIVEDGELGAREICEVSCLNKSKVDCEQVLLVENQTPDPFVVRPATHAGN